MATSKSSVAGREVIQQGLHNPFPVNLLKFRPTSLSEDKTKGLPVFYIDARIVMERLDNMLGCFNWYDRYKFHDEFAECFLYVRDPVSKKFIAKCDVGSYTKIEKHKGGCSDAFKRAAVKWGVGRYIYYTTSKYLPVDEYGHFKEDPRKLITNPKLLPDESLKGTFRDMENAPIDFDALNSIDYDEEALSEIEALVLQHDNVSDEEILAKSKNRRAEILASLRGES